MSERKTTPESGADVSARGRSRRVLFHLIAVLAGLMPLIIVELGLRVFDVGRPADSPDPFAGFNRNVPLFERNGAVYRTARSRAPFVAPAEFPVEKPTRGFRAFCFGGSTVYGHPYLGATAFPQWLELELAAGDPARSWQVINCGGVSYASYRIAPLVREVLQYQPDLIVLATGHNEFLEDRTYHTLKERSTAWTWIQGRLNSLRLVGVARRALAGGQPAQSPVRAGPADDSDPGPTVSTRLDNASGYASYHRDDAWHQRVVSQFDESVRDIVARCQAAHVPILLVKLGSNLRDCPPFKSEHRAGLAQEPEADWQAAFDLATTVAKADPLRALQYYQAAAAIDDRHALLSYRIARTLDRMGRPKEALNYYEKARDEDVCPLRITSPLAQTLTRIASDTRTPLVDAASLLAARSPDRLPGFDWYVDHVHPTIRGHQLIARALAAEIRRRGLVAQTAEWPEDQRLAAHARHLQELGPAYFADGVRRVGWLERWAQRQRLAPEITPNDAPGYARLAFRRLDLGDDDAAWDALREALKRDRSVSELIQAHAQELVAEGRPARAAALLRQLN